MSSEDPGFPSVVVLVPLHKDGSVFRKCLSKLQQVEYPSLEIVVMTDELDIQLPPPVAQVKTGSKVSTPPGVKRDAGMASTDSKYVAFIDDDAYPRSDWITEAVEILESDDRIAGVGGPGLTPDESTFRERASGAIYQSLFGSGPLRFRFLPQSRRAVDDLPAYNFIARRSAIESVGGWASNFYGGEDTKLCMELVRKGFVLQYSPLVVVYHFRRPVILSHMRQVANVGKHRGYFVKRFPDTSRKLVYVMPAVFLSALSLLLGASVWFGKGTNVSMSLGLLAYVLVVAESLRREPLSVALTLPIFLFTHHVAYGFGFLRGLMQRELDK